jgi:hypothetical protein
LGHCAIANKAALNGAIGRATVKGGCVAVVASLAGSFEVVAAHFVAPRLSACRAGAVPSGLNGAAAAAAIVISRVAVVAGLVAGQLAVPTVCITALWSCAITCESTLNDTLSRATIAVSRVVIIAGFVANLLAVAAHLAAF